MSHVPSSQGPSSKVNSLRHQPLSTFKFTKLGEKLPSEIDRSDKHNTRNFTKYCNSIHGQKYNIYKDHAIKAIVYSNSYYIT